LAAFILLILKTDYFVDCVLKQKKIMKPEYENVLLINNEQAERFEMTADGFTAIITYKLNHFTFTLLHTEVPPQFEGKGAATAIIEKTLEYIEKNHFKLIPFCPLVVAYIKRHPQWKMILDPGVQNNY